MLDMDWLCRGEKEKLIIRISEEIKKVVWFFFIIIIGYLLIASIFSTCYIGQLQYITDITTKQMEINVEHTYYIRDYWWIHFLIFALISCIMCRLGKKENRENRREVSLVLCLIAGVIALAIVLLGQYYPKFDQRHIIELATALRHGDLSSLDVGGYLHKYPYQIGIILFYQLLSVIFGDLNVIAFELVNVLFIVITYYLLVKIAKLLWMNNMGNMVAFICLLFLPYLLYATFLYGTVVGLMFALLTFYMILLFQREPKAWHIFAGSISMAFSVAFKSNYLIFLIAAVLYLFFSNLKQMKKNKAKFCGKIIFIIVLIGCYCISNKGIDLYLKSLNSGVKLEGVPMSSFVALGLQDGKSAPGWHNNYDGAVWERNHYDHELANTEAKQEIINIITKYPQDITAAISFFVKKISSQWNNPTFQSLWLLEGRSGKSGLHWLLEGAGRYGYTFFVNILQTFILAGTFLFSIFRTKKYTWEEMLLPITFIGGFVFHIFWEAKCIYAISYFVLLLPLCVKGYNEWQLWLLTQKTIIQENGWKSEIGNKMKIKIALTTIVLIVVCLLSYTETFAKLFARNEDTGIFNVYTQEMVNQDILLLEDNS